MQILDYLLCVIEDFVIILFFDKLLKRRFQGILPFIAGVIFLSFFTFILSNYNIVLKTLFGFLNIFVVSSVLYKERLIIKSGYALMALYVLSIIDIIFGVLISLVLNEAFLNVFYSSFWLRLFVCLIIKAFDILIFILIYKGFKKIQYDMRPKIWVLYNSVMLVFLIITTAFIVIYSQKQQDAETSLLFLIISSSFFVMSMVVIYFFTEICFGFQRDKKLYVLESGYETLQDRIALQNRTSEIIKKLNHDMNKHITYACTLIEQGKKESAIKLLDEAIGKVKKSIPHIDIESGSDIVDAIITSKIALAERKQIAFDYYIEPLEAVEMDVLDLSSLISNVIDNAFEAAEQSEKAFVKFKMFKYNAYWTVYTENSYSSGIVLERTLHLLSSTKPDKFQHGYGSQIIKDIALKYNGEVTWEADGEIFKTIVLLKI